MAGKKQRTAGIFVRKRGDTDWYRFNPSSFKIPRYAFLHELIKLEAVGNYLSYVDSLNKGELGETHEFGMFDDEGNRLDTDQK